DRVDEVRALDRVAADADRGRLAEPERGQLVHDLVGQRVGARHDADAARLVDVAGHDADLALTRRDHARTVRADQDDILVVLVERLGAGVEHRDLLWPRDLAAALARRDAGDDARAVLDHLLRVKRARRAGHALDDELGVESDEDAHDLPPAALTTFCAPSAMSDAVTMLSPLSASIFLPS